MTTRTSPEFRWFTPTQASITLQRVLPSLARAAEALGAFRELKEQLERHESMDDESRDLVDRELERHRERLRLAVEEVNAAGVMVRGIDPPALDFPAQHNGRDVMLSWREGERAVAWWYAPEEGPEARQPIHDPHSGHWEWMH